MTAQPSQDDRAVLSRQLRRWREDLIDLSKHNRLLWFRPTRATTFELREPELSHLYLRTMSGQAWRFFRPPDLGEVPADPPRQREQDELVTDKTDALALQRGLRTLDRRGRACARPLTGLRRFWG